MNEYFEYEVHDFEPERSKFLFSRPKEKGRARFILIDPITGYILGAIDGCGSYYFEQKEVK